MVSFNNQNPIPPIVQPEHVNPKVETPKAEELQFHPEQPQQLWRFHNHHPKTRQIPPSTAVTAA